MTISLSSHAPPSLRKARSFINFRKSDWEGFTAETERIFANTPLPTSCSAGEKVFGRILGDTERHMTPAVMLGTIAALSPKLCDDPSSQRETCAALMTLSTLPSSCWTWTSSDMSARKCKTSGNPCWNPPTALLVPSSPCASWAARDRVPHQIYQSPNGLFSLV